MKNKTNISIGMALGLAAGSILSMVLNNGGVWIPVGIALGAGIGGRLDHMKKKKENEQD
jgi:hypothetical protein